MPKLICFSGLPGSGKTTMARNRMVEDGNAVRLNRDELRAMLHTGRWSGAKEKVTKRIQREAAIAALKMGRNVIIDDTNILGSGIAPWEQLARELRTDGDGRNVEFEHVDLTGRVTIDECIRRDVRRGEPAQVGRGVIDRMALFGDLIDLDVDVPVAIIDIDGTLADLRHRLHYIQPETGTGKKDYDRFFAGVSADGYFDEVMELMDNLFRTHYVILLSGRPTNTGMATRLWLDRYWRSRQVLPYHRLFMRQSGDHRPDVEVKREIFDAMVRAGLRKDNVDVVIDDRPQIVALWRELELPVIQVENGRPVQAWADMADLPQAAIDFLTQEAHA